MKVQYLRGVTTPTVSSFTMVVMTSIDTHPPAVRSEPSAGAILTSVVRTLGPVRGPSRFLIAIAGLFVMSSVFHLAVFVVDGGGWSGPLSWRKPIVFSLSFGLLLWGVAWLLDLLPDRRRTAWTIAVVLAMTSIAETGLIGAQTWRGRASHFNDATGGDVLIFSLMGVMVGFISLALVAVFVWSLIERPSNRSERLAAWWGFALIMSGLGIGQWLLQLGGSYVNRVGSVPDSVVNGEAGVVKYPHALAFHGIQVFMIVLAVVGAVGLSSAASARVMRFTVVAYLAVMALSLWQAMVGRSLSDPTVVTVLLAMVAVACTVAAGVSFGGAVLRRDHAEELAS